MKKIILFILTLSLIVGAIPFSLATYAVESGTCGENLTWTLDGGTLTISGTGEMKNYYKSLTVINIRKPVLLNRSPVILMIGVRYFTFSCVSPKIYSNFIAIFINI